MLEQLNKAIAEKLSSSVNVLQQDYVGTLKRCLKNLELNSNDAADDDDETSSTPASKALQEVKIE